MKILKELIELKEMKINLNKEHFIFKIWLKMIKIMKIIIKNNIRVILIINSNLYIVLSLKYKWIKINEFEKLWIIIIN